MSHNKNEQNGTTLYKKPYPLHGLVPLPIIRNRSGWIVGGTGCEEGYDEVESSAPLASPLARTTTLSSLEFIILEPRSIWREVAAKFLGAKGGIAPLGGGKGGKFPPPKPPPNPPGGGPKPGGGIPLGGKGGAPGGIMGGKPGPGPGPGGKEGPTLRLLT